MCRYRNKSYVCSHVLAFRPLWWHSVGADVFVLRRRRRFVSFVCLPLLKKYILIFPHALCCELFSGRDDGHRERRHEEERVFTRRARIEEFPQSGRGFSVRTSRFDASFVARSMNKLFRVTTGFALCGFVVMMWPRRNATRAQFQNIVAVVGDVRRRSGTKTPWVLDVAFAPRKREENHRVVLRR